MIHSDATFSIGKTHKVCQDYAIADNRHAALRSVWLSDGCSSSPNTDIGARLLSLGMQQRLLGLGSAKEIHPLILDTALQKNLRFALRGAKQMGLSATALDATLLGLVCVPGSEQDSVSAVLYGDGAVVFGRSDGRREVYRSQYPAGYPYYPAYGTDPDRLASWWAVPNNAQILTRTVLLPNGNVETSETFSPVEPCHVLSRPAGSLRFAAVLSDGIESFQAKTGAETSVTSMSVDYLAVVRELTAFKNFKGEFVHRRLQSFERDCSRRGWHHKDDVSVAALYFEKE